MTSYQPVRVQRRRSKGWRTPICGCGCGLPARYVGRGSRWGNPARVICWRDYVEGVTIHSVDLPDGECLGSYGPELGFDPCHHAHQVAVDYYVTHRMPSVDALDALRGHDLMCWCSLDLPCHADALLQAATRDGGAA